MASDGFPSCVLNFLGIFSESHLSAVHSSSESLIRTSMLDQSCCCHVILGSAFGRSAIVSPAEEKRDSLKQQQKRWLVVVVGCSSETNKKTNERNTGYFPQPQMARTGALTRVFITRSTHGPLTHTGSCGGRRGARDFAAVHKRPSTAEAHASTAPHTEAADPRQATNPWRPRRFAVERRDGGLSMIAADAASSLLAVPAARHLVASRRALKTVHAISSAVIAKHPTRNDYFGIAAF